MPNGIAYQFTFARILTMFLDIFRDIVLHTIWKFDFESPHLYGRIRSSTKRTTDGSLRDVGSSSEGSKARTNVLVMGSVDRSVPISKEEFQRGEGRTALEDRVRQFLFDNPDQAFTVYEISDELGFIESSPSSQEGQPNMQMVSIQVILLKLFDNGIVESRIVDDGDSSKRYYRART